MGSSNAPSWNRAWQNQTCKTSAMPQNPPSMVRSLLPAALWSVGHRCRRIVLALALSTAGMAGSGPSWAEPAPPTRPAPQLPRDGWKDCGYNDQTIGCVDEQLPDGLRIVWEDGLQMTYRFWPTGKSSVPQRLRDRLGGLWQREILPQGNMVLTNVQSGNRIFVPLRYPCKPPLKGEVGFCRE
jgi:hypothetical protein